MDQYDVQELYVEKNQMIKLPTTHARSSKNVLVVLEGKLVHSENKTLIEPGHYVVVAESDINQHMRALEQSRLLVIAALSSKQNYHSPGFSAGKEIANRIMAGEPIDAQLIQAFTDTLKIHDPFEGDLFNQYADLFLTLFAELPLEPMRLSKTYCARLCAKWVIGARNLEAAIPTVFKFIGKVYQDLFITANSHEIVKNAVYWTLLNNAEKKTVQYLSDKLYTNRTYLSERFKQLTGISLSNYIQRVKMYGAMLLLIDKSLTTPDIIEILGYKDEAHFMKSFKKFSGMTPVEYTRLFGHLGTSD